MKKQELKSLIKEVLQEISRNTLQSELMDFTDPYKLIKVESSDDKHYGDYIGLSFSHPKTGAIKTLKIEALDKGILDVKLM